MSAAVPPTQPPLSLYVVSPAKLLVLNVATFNLYSVFWFWCHWVTISRNEQKVLFPFFRAVFSFIYVTLLFKRFYVAAEQRGKAFSRWSYFNWAAVYIVLWVARNIYGHPQFILKQSSIALVAMVLLGILLSATIILIKAQTVANYASGDADGERGLAYAMPEKIAAMAGSVLWLLILIQLIFPKAG